jgi:hypothetical protein
LGLFWLQLIWNDPQPHNCNPLRIPSNSCHDFGTFEPFLNTLHICWFPSLLVKASGNPQLEFPHSDPLVNLSLLVHIWCSPSSEVQPSKYCEEKNCFHHFDHLAPISNTVLIWQQPNLLAQPSQVPQASSSPCWHSFWQKFISLDNQAPKPNPVLGIPKHPFCEAGHIWTISECCSYPAIHKQGRFLCKSIEALLARNNVTVESFWLCMSEGDWKGLLFLLHELLLTWTNCFSDCLIEDGALQAILTDAVSL